VCSTHEDIFARAPSGRRPYRHNLLTCPCPRSSIVSTIASEGKDNMLDWTRWFRTSALIKPTPTRALTIASVERPRPIPSCGKYQPLYKYLDDRYATIVVLTFSESTNGPRVVDGSGRGYARRRLRRCVEVGEPHRRAEFGGAGSRL